MRSIGALPKSVLILEILGMILLAAALLSLNQYLTLPAPMNSPLAVTVMIFLGILLMLPAAVALMWRIAQLIAPQLMTRSPDSSSRSAREKRMTPTIDLIRGHRSIRHFTDEPISDAQRESIIAAARGTSSSSFYSAVPLSALPIKPCAKRWCP